MQLYSTALMLAVGRTTIHSPAWVWPWFAALCGIALAIGFCTANTLAGFPAAPMPSPERLIPSALLLFHGAAALLSIGSATAIQKDIFGSLLHMLPLTPWQRTTAWLMPSFCLCLLGIFLIMPVVVAVFGAMGLSASYVLLAGVTGLFAGIGLVHGLPRPWNILAVIGACCLEYLSVRLLHNNSISFEAAVLPIILCGGIIMGSLVLLWRCHTVLLQRSPDTFVSTLTRVRIPARFWSWAKLVRNRTMQISILTGLFVSAGLAFYAHRQALPAELMLSATAILGASIVSDLRGNMRRNNPPEICALKGTWYFHWHCLAIYALSCFSVTPLLWIMLAQDQPATLLITSTLLLGYTAGTLASTIIASPNRNIATQFATLATTTLLFFVLPASFRHNLTSTTQSLALLSLSSGLWVAAYGIEYRRNAYIWRT